MLKSVVPSPKEVEAAEKVLADYDACLDTVDSKETSCYCIKTYFHAFTEASKILIAYDRHNATTPQEHQRINQAERVILNPDRKKLIQNCSK